MSQVFIESGEAFVFEARARVLKLDDCRAYRDGVEPLIGASCVDFVVRAGDRLVLLEAKNYDRDDLRPGDVDGKLDALASKCAQKALGALAVACRWGLLDASNTEFGWRDALDHSLDGRVTFGLYVGLPADHRYQGRRIQRRNQQARHQRVLGHLQRQLARVGAVGWLARDVRLVQRHDPTRLPGLCAIEPAPPRWAPAEREAFTGALRACAALGAPGARQRVRRLRAALPDDMARRMPDRDAPFAQLLADLDWLDADHPDRRDADGAPALRAWAEAAVDALLAGDPDWHARLAAHLT